MCNPSFSYHTRPATDRPVTYVVTGKTPGGKRIKITTASRIHAFGINLWRGSVWIIEGPRRRRIKRVLGTL